MDEENKMEEKSKAGFIDIIQMLEKLGFEVLEIKRDFNFIENALDIKIKKK